jgi:hypothetical protein
MTPQTADSRGVKMRERRRKDERASVCARERMRQSVRREGESVCERERGEG